MPAVAADPATPAFGARIWPGTPATGMAPAIRRQLLAPEGSGGAFAGNGGEVEPGEFAQAWPRGEECHGYDGCRGEGAGGGADVSVETHEVAVERAEESCGGQSAEDEAGQDPMVTRSRFSMVISWESRRCGTPDTRGAAPVGHRGRDPSGAGDLRPDDQLRRLPIAETIRVLLLITLPIVTFNLFLVTPLMIVFLAVLNEAAILSIAFDHVRGSDTPAAWDMRTVLVVAAALAAMGVAETFLLFALLART